MLQRLRSPILKLPPTSRNTTRGAGRVVSAIRTTTIACAVIGAAQLITAASAGAAEPVQLPTVEVVGATPVPGTDVPRERIPANVQTLDAGTLRRSHSLSLPELLTNHVPG